MAKNTLSLNNAPKATGKVDDTLDVTEALKLLEEPLDAPAPPAPRAERDEPTAAVDADDHIAVVASKLGDFRLSPLARGLLDRAVVNVSENTGRGLEDPVAKDMAVALGGIIKASRCDLGKAITALVGGEDPMADATMVYKLCYQVQKALNFIGNMAYRRALDPKGDFDLDKFIDPREERVDPPVGCGPDEPEEIAFGPDGERLFNVVGGAERRADYEQVADALEELHIYLQLMTEMFGWDPTSPLPYMVVMGSDETFTAVHNLEECLDRMEIRYKESRAKRQTKQLDHLRAAQARALAVLKAAAR